MKMEKVYCVLLAGGVGSRMKTANIPKQFLKINNVPVIIQTIKNISQYRIIDKIIIAMHPNWHDYFNELTEEFKVDMMNIIITDGGGERIDSIENALTAIKEHKDSCDESIDPKDVVIIHDAVRPFVEEVVINECVSKAREYGAALATTPAADTMLYSEGGEFVEEIPVRSYLYNGQAPDAIRLLDFLKALNSLTPEQRSSNFGTVQISKLGGLKVYMVPSTSKNMKITQDSDLIIANAILENEADK